MDVSPEETLTVSMHGQAIVSLRVWDVVQNNIFTYPLGAVGISVVVRWPNHRVSLVAGAGE